MRLWFLIVVIMCAILFSKSGTAALFRNRNNNTIVALLSVHAASTGPIQCTNELNFKSAVQSQALVYAVDKLSMDPNFKDIPLGIDIEDICQDKPENVLNTMNTLYKRLNAHEPTAFLADLSDLSTQLVVHKSQNVPVFTLASQRPGDGAFTFEANKPRIGIALARLVQQLNWTVFDVLVANGSAEYEHFKEATKASKICENRMFVEKLLSHQTLGNGNETYPLLVFSDTLKTLANLPSKLKERDAIIASDFLEIDRRFPKTLALKQPTLNLDEFEEFLLKTAQNNNSWFGRLIRDSAQFGECKTPGSLSCWSVVLGKLSAELRHAGKVIDAAYTIAHALKSTKKMSLKSNDIVATPEFASPTGRKICFSANKDLSKVQYDVYNLAKNHSTTLGNVQTLPNDAEAKLSLDEIDLNRDTSGCLATCPEGFSPAPTALKCCVTCEKENSTACAKGLRLSKDGMKCVEVRVDYLKWKHPLSIVIFILAIILFCVLLCLANLYHKKAQTSVILTSKLATFPLLLSLFITLIYPLLPIIKPSSTSCNAYVFGFIQALGIPLCVLISRSNSFFKKFRDENGSRSKVLRSNPQNLIAIFLILFQVTLSIIFVAVTSAHVVHYETSDPYVDYIECSTFSTAEFLFPFFFTIILSLFFTVKNFGAETNEEDTYESHFTAIFFFAFYFLSFVNIVVVYGVVGKVKIMLLSVLGVLHLLNFLFFIFLPKVYVILFKRDLIRFSPFPLNSDRQVLILDFNTEQPGIEIVQRGDKRGSPE